MIDFSNLVNKDYGLQYISIMLIRALKNGYRPTKPVTVFNRKREMLKAKNIVKQYRKERKQ